MTLVLWDQELAIERLQRRIGLRLPIVEVFSNDPRLAKLADWSPEPLEHVTGDRLYFRQLLAGSDFAARRAVARQMVNFVYLIGDRETGEAVAVDPAYAPGEVVALLEADGMRLTGVLATHYHADHVGGDLFGHAIAGIARAPRADRGPYPRPAIRGAVDRARRPGSAATASWPTRATTSSRSARSRSACCTRRAIRREASASSSTGASWPATRSSCRAAGEPTSRAATPPPCTTAL